MRKVVTLCTVLFILLSATVIAGCQQQPELAPPAPTPAPPTPAPTEALPPTSAPVSPAEFEASSLSITPTDVVGGEEVTVTADVSNVGETEGTYTVILKVNGVEVGTKDFLVAAGDSKAVSFRLTEDDPGTYTIDLEGLTGTFRVLKPAEFKVSNLRITPEEVKVGGDATLKVNIKNTGEVEGTCPVILKVNGVEAETKEVVVAAGGIKAISFELTKGEPGTYTIDLEGLIGEVNFRELKPAEFKLTEDIIIYPNPVKVGEEASITINIRNVGEAEDTYTARLVVDGKEEQTKDVTLAGYKSQKIVFGVSKDSPGSYSVEIGDREAVLEVFEPVRLRTGTKIVRDMRSSLGRLEITENSLVEDSVIVLCSSEEPGIPLTAVYIQAGDTYTIVRIYEGTYVIYITTGRDWDDDSKKFRTSATYGHFAHATGPGEVTNEWEFKETGSSYTIWMFSLKPVPGGVWSTQFISEAEFPEMADKTSD